jgi:S-methylmethionine-dependent homocysteine/selenocysteine methylase
MEPHSGFKFGACFSSPQYPNNKWLITPRMTMGDDASIRFWVQTYNASYGLEKFNVGVSTTGSDPADFVLLNSTPLDAPAIWTKQSFPLTTYSGQDVYIGINCVSDDQFIFMIDDIEIGSALSVDETSNKTDVILYPNPASDHAFVNFDKTEMVVTNMTLLDGTGTSRYPDFPQAYIIS